MITVPHRRPLRTISQILREKMTTPTKLKKLLGNPGKRELPAEPEFPPLSLVPPDRLSEGAKKEYIRLGPMLISTGIVTAADLSVYCDYCESYAACETLRAQLEKQGLTYLDKNGHDRRNPVYLVYSAERTHLDHLRQQLGLTPTARRKLEGLVAESESQSDPWLKDYEIR